MDESNERNRQVIGPDPTAQCPGCGSRETVVRVCEDETVVWGVADSEHGEHTLQLTQVPHHECTQEACAVAWGIRTGYFGWYTDDDQQEQAQQMNELLKPLIGFDWLARARELEAKYLKEDA